MDHLLRGHAPISDAGWALLDAEARRRLTVNLGARKLVDFVGPQGWAHSATNLGRTEAVSGLPADAPGESAAAPTGAPTDAPTQAPAGTPPAHARGTPADAPPTDAPIHPTPAPAPAPARAPNTDAPTAASPIDAVSARQRRVLPLTEVRAEFTVSRAELLDYDRGAADADLSSLEGAAARMARLENITVFHGWAGGGLTGITEASVHAPVPRGSDFNDYPRRAAKAVATLLNHGISGPYGLAVGPSDYTAIIETTEHGGYPLFDHLRQILGGPIVWTPGVRGGVVLSLRGGDFLFESGQDLAIGYDHHDGEAVHLYLEQSFSFRVATPEAAVALASA